MLSWHNWAWSRSVVYTLLLLRRQLKHGGERGYSCCEGRPGALGPDQICYSQDTTESLQSLPCLSHQQFCLHNAGALHPFKTLDTVNFHNIRCAK
jgi:hypothetical protein